MNIWQKRAPGVLLCLAVALLAWFLVELAPALEIVGSAVLGAGFFVLTRFLLKNHLNGEYGMRDLFHGGRRGGRGAPLFFAGRRGIGRARSS